jgi:O-antigen/teichoic acid export membrane protein
MEDHHAEADEALRGLFGRDSVYLGLWAVQLVWAALFTPITSRLLGATNFGVASAATAVMQILVSLGGFGMQTALQRVFERSGEIAARKAMAASIGIATVVCLAAAATGVLWAAPLGFGSFSAVVRECVAWGWLTAITSAGLGLLRSRDQLRPFATATLLQSVAAEGLGLVFVVAIKATAAEYLMGIVIAQAAAALCVLFSTAPLPAGRSDRRMIQTSVKFGAGLVPAALAQFVFDASDRLVVHGDLGSVATARYSVARNIGGLTVVLLTVMNNVWMPRVFAFVDGPLLRTVLRTSRDAIYAILVPLILGLGAVSPYLLSLWVPPSYRPLGMQVVLSIISATAFFAAIGTAATRALLHSGKTATVGVLTTLAAVVNLGLNLILVPTWGLTGSAVATLASYAALGVMLHISGQRVMGVDRSPPSLFLAGGLSIGASLALTQAPVWGPFIAVRVLLALITAIWFFATLASIVRPERLPRLSRLIRGWIGMPPINVEGLPAAEFTSTAQEPFPVETVS